MTGQCHRYDWQIANGGEIRPVRPNLEGEAENELAQGRENLAITAVRYAGCNILHIKDQMPLRIARQGRENAGVFAAKIAVGQRLEMNGEEDDRLVAGTAQLFKHRTDLPEDHAVHFRPEAGSH